MHKFLAKIYSKYETGAKDPPFKCGAGKESKGSISFLRHQSLPADYFSQLPNHQRGLLLFHGLGSGKTLSSILMSINAITSGLAKKVIVLTPASLKANYSNELDLYFKNNPIAHRLFTILSYNTEKVVKDIKDLDLTDKIVVVDEAHNLFSMIASDSKIGRTLYKKMLNSSRNTRFIFLSGTPVLNTPYEIALLYNVLRPGLFFNDPAFTRKQFEDYYQLYEYTNDDFKNRIQGLTSYYSGVTDKRIFPTVTFKDIQIKMSPFQTAMYKRYLEIEKGNLFVNKIKKTIKSKSEDIDPLLSSYKVFTRQACNFADIHFKGDVKDVKLSDYSPKYQRLLQFIKKSPGPVLVYSNFLETGINIIAKLLTLDNITHVSWTGKDSENIKAEHLAAFNSPKNNRGQVIKCFLITAAGAEGISLKNVRQVHIIEPHWNAVREQQVIGRAMRICSHYSLPKAQQNVHVFRYYSVTNSLVTADILLKRIALAKAKTTERFTKLIIESAIDCKFSTSKNCLYK